MAHDLDYFRRRAAEARHAAYHKGDGEGVAVAGDLALAYTALARRSAQPTGGEPAPTAASEDQPLMLQS